jgi:hypothetical protein
MANPREFAASQTPSACDLDDRHPAQAFARPRQVVSDPDLAADERRAGGLLPGSRTANVRSTASVPGYETGLIAPHQALISFPHGGPYRPLPSPELRDGRPGISRQLLAHGWPDMVFKGIAAGHLIAADAASAGDVCRSCGSAFVHS